MDASASSANVLIINPNVEEVVLPCRTRLGSWSLYRPCQWPGRNYISQQTQLWCYQNTWSATKCEKPAPAEDFLFRDILCAPAMGANRILTESTGNRDRDRIPRWRLAREGPFTNERSQASLRILGKGCAFRHTTYSAEDHAPPEGGLGVPLNHPRFLEWISAPTSAWFLEMSPGQWCDTLSRDQAMTAAMQLHKDTCLMNTNLDILDQYALALHGTASKIL